MLNMITCHYAVLHLTAGLNCFSPFSASSTHSFPRIILSPSVLKVLFSIFFFYDQNKPCAGDSNSAGAQQMATIHAPMFFESWKSTEKSKTNNQLILPKGTDAQISRSPWCPWFPPPLASPTHMFHVTVSQVLQFIEVNGTNQPCSAFSLFNRLLIVHHLSHFDCLST